MKIKPKKVLINIPMILSFDDYHEIDHVKNFYNQLISNKKIKSKELFSNNYGYSAIFYFKQDDEYKRLIKEYKQLNKEEYQCE